MPNRNVKQYLYQNDFEAFMQKDSNRKAGNIRPGPSQEDVMKMRRLMRLR